MPTPHLKLSVLDLSPVPQGGTAATALANSLDLARLAETLGFARYWVAEHHNHPGIAGAATSVVIGHIAAGTSRIRVGSGGIMLPNHAPLAIAEQFGTLAALYPDRIDLGLGRAPGGDRAVIQAFSRGAAGGSDTFANDVQMLQHWFGPADPEAPLRAFPGEGSAVPIWILGSSTYGAQLAAYLGLPFAFASHFAPDALDDAIALYRQGFRPSPACPQPYLAAGVNVVAADTDAGAQHLFTSFAQSFVALRRGRPMPLPPPIDNLDAVLGAGERAMLAHATRYAIVGGPATVRGKLAAFAAATRVDEVVVTTQIFNHAARRHSFEIVAAARDALAYPVIGADAA